jgi:hypothetical protein
VTFGVSGGSLKASFDAAFSETNSRNLAINQASDILVAIGNDKMS